MLSYAGRKNWDAKLEKASERAEAGKWELFHLKLGREGLREDKKSTIPQDDNNSERRKHIHTKQIRFLLIV